MIPRKNLPEDAANWTSVSITFPRLKQDSADSCPESEDHIFDYVRLESADTALSERARFRFVRTARVADIAYWLWEYTEGYVVFRQNADGSTILGLSEPNGLSHEQYLLADYYDEIYWS